MYPMTNFRSLFDAGIVVESIVKRGSPDVDGCIVAPGGKCICEMCLCIVRTQYLIERYNDEFLDLQRTNRKLSDRGCYCRIVDFLVF